MARNRAQILIAAVDETRRAFRSIEGSLSRLRQAEAASLRLGDQVVAEWVPLIGISYDPRDDLIEIALEGLDHLTPKPRVIFVDAEGDSLASREIVDAEDQRQIVRLADPLMLPPPRR
ncbi:MAG: DUF5335 family protein [Rhodothalassiaceae bacterium]